MEKLSKYFTTYLSEFVYGGTDGLITTYSVISGSAGGELTRNVILILGISNVLSDGYSMGISRYLSSQTEIAQGILTNKDATQSAIATFLFFVLIGMIPVIPFIFYSKKYSKILSFIMASIMFYVIGYTKGTIVEKNASPNEKGFATFLMGTSASAISYFVGKSVNSFL